MIRSYSISRSDLKAGRYKEARRATIGEKPPMRDVKQTADILRRVPNK